MSLNAVVRPAAMAATLALVSVPVSAGAVTFKTIYNFTGQADSLQPGGSLYVHDGKIYGATLGTFAMAHFTCKNTGCANAFEFDVKTSTMRVMHTFSENANGYFPQTGLIPYGTRFYGIDFTGIYSYGAMFSIDRSTGAERTVYDMAPADASVAWYPPVLYKGTFYVTASDGGSGSGTLFKIDPSTGKHTILYGFSGGEDGFYPLETPVVVNGKLYGTTVYGGMGNCGVLFEYDLAKGRFKVVHDFTGGKDGKWPSGSFIVDKGIIYGAMANGGIGFGALFKFDPATHRFTVLHAFNGGTEGYGPGPVALSGGKFYVSSYGGGIDQWGTVVQIDEATGKTVVVHSFTGESDGIWPGTLVASGGRIYGLTQTEYPFVYNGTLFEITP